MANQGQNVQIAPRMTRLRRPLTAKDKSMRRYEILPERSGNNLLAGGIGRSDPSLNVSRSVFQSIGILQ